MKRKVAGVSPLGPGHEKKRPPLLGGIQVSEHILVNRPAKVCYDFWRDFKNLPKILHHLQVVEVIDDQHSHWTVAGPADSTMEWDAEIIEDRPNERIAWRSSENAQIDNAGSVQFVPQAGNRQTEVKVTLSYNPALGPVGELISELFGETPDEELKDDLNQFKKTLEAASAVS